MRLVAAAALNGAEFAVTRANLQSGGQDLDPCSHVRPLGAGTGGKLCRRTRGRDQSRLFLAQDRLSQTGAGRLPGQHRKLRRRVEFRVGAPLTNKVGLKDILLQNKKKGRARKRGLQI
jgi:hypothetical protein